MGGIFDGKVSHNRDKNYDMILEMIRGLKPSGNFLDIGTHCGFFLRRARDRGWDLYGVEPSPTNSALATEKFGLNVITGYLDEAKFPNRFFDVVTMLDVIEHVTDPLNLLGEIHRILKDDGVLIIKTPNGEYNLLKYRIFTKALRMYRYDAFDIREHIIHYSQGTIAALLQKADFRVEQCQVAYPIQVGEAWKKMARYLAYRAALVYSALSNGFLPDFCTDMIVTAKKQVGEESTTAQVKGARTSKAC